MLLLSQLSQYDNFNIKIQCFISYQQIFNKSIKDWFILGSGYNFFDGI